MSYSKIDQNDKIAWDYPSKGYLFDKTRQRFARCDRENVENYVALLGNDADNYLARLDWQPIERLLYKGVRENRRKNQNDKTNS